jgi:hypothetical protein
MAELADAADSKSADLRVLGVRLPLPAPLLYILHYPAYSPAFMLDCSSFFTFRAGQFLLLCLIEYTVVLLVQAEKWEDGFDLGISCRRSPC